MNNVKKPIVFMNGDSGTGMVAPKVLESIFSNYPTINVPLTVADRVNTNDACIARAVSEIQRVGVGFKNSTASKDPRIIQAGLGSANIKMRPMAGAYGILRLLQIAINYDNICGTLRYAHGGFYDEQSCVIKNIDDRETAVITTQFDLKDLTPFAELALEISKRFNLDLVLSSKNTIAKSETLFKERIEAIWNKADVVWKHKLTDIALAELPVKTALGGSKKGNFLHVADNVNGDNSSDIIDHQNGGFVMGSDVHCIKDGKKFTYFELPGGTADDYVTGDLPGRNFLNPSSIILGLCNAFQVVNPDDKPFFDVVKSSIADYLKEVQPEDRHTQEMIDYVAKTAQAAMSVV